MMLFNLIQRNQEESVLKSVRDLQWIKWMLKSSYVKVKEVVTTATNSINLLTVKLPKDRLWDRESNLSALIENTSDIIWSIDKNYKILISNPAFRKLVENRKGRTPMPGDLVEYDYFPEQSVELWQDYYQMAFEGKSFSAETSINSDGISKIIEHSFNPIFAKNQEIIGVTVFGRDISTRKIVERELISARRKAEEASRVKAEFLSTMSHEIRTPLNAVIGITHLLQHESPRKDQKEYLETLKFSSETLLSLVNDILDYNKIVEGKIQMEEINFDVKELIKGLKHSFLLKAAEKNIQLKVSIDDTIPSSLTGDKARIAQILNNLIGNAIKFTEKGSIRLEVSLNEESEKDVHVNFSISDTGIGIPENKLKKIFDRFTQASSDTSRKFGGTGLGLAITKKLLELLKSEIHVESELGKGSHFYFSMCLKKTVSQWKHQVARKLSNNLLQGNLRGLRVLLVEDNKVNQLVASEFLKRWNVKLMVAMSGSKAIEIVKKNRFDLILMDLQMPEMDGYATCRAIKRMTTETQNIPIVALTANALQEVQDKVYNAGMSDIVTKPFDPDELYSKLSQYPVRHHNEMKQKADFPGLFNNAMLSEIVQGNEQFLESIITSFIAELALFRSNYKEMMQNGNLKNFKAAKHKISPSLKLFEAASLESMINSGESLLISKNKSNNDLRIHIQKIYRQIESVMLKLHSKELSN